MFTRADRRMLKEILFLVAAATKGAVMAIDLSGLTQAVNDEVTVDDSVLTLITGLQARIAGLASSRADAQTQININQLVTQLQAEKQRLAAAVLANTPAAATTPATAV
jgi:hypothetical protein